MDNNKEGEIRMKQNKYGDFEFEIGVTKGDFKNVFGREPTDDEFMDFAHDCKKAVEGQIDWDIVFNVVREDWARREND